MIWVALVLVVALVGRALQDADRAADPRRSASTRGPPTRSGINVYAIRYGAVIALRHARRRGRRVPLDRLRRSFNENMTAGRGFIALAAVIFGNWRPFGAACGLPPVRLLERARAAPAGVLERRPATLFQALPYVLTLIAVAGVIGRSIPPPPIGRPYVKQ